MTLASYRVGWYSFIDHLSWPLRYHTITHSHYRHSLISSPSQISNQVSKTPGYRILPDIRSVPSRTLTTLEMCAPYFRTIHLIIILSICTCPLNRYLIPLILVYYQPWTTNLTSKQASACSTYTETTSKAKI